MKPDLNKRLRYRTPIEDRFDRPGMYARRATDVFSPQVLTSKLAFDPPNPDEILACTPKYLKGTGTYTCGARVHGAAKVAERPRG